MPAKKQRVPVFSRKFMSLSSDFDHSKIEFYVRCNKGEEIGPFDTITAANKAAKKHYDDTKHKVIVESSQSD